MKRKSLVIAGVLSSILLSGCVTVPSVPGAKPGAARAASVHGPKAKARTPKNPPKSERAALVAVAPEPKVRADVEYLLAEAPPVELDFEPEVVAVEVQPERVWEGTPPLALSSRDWGNAVEGFRYHAAMARKAITEGGVDDVRRHASLAAASASGRDEAAEAKAMLAMADLMEGKGGVSITAGLVRPTSDWRAAETARRGIAGTAGSLEVRSALAEIRAWPSPVAAKVVRWLAAASREHHDLLREVTEFARELDRAGMLAPGVMGSIEGYGPRMAEPEAVESAPVNHVPVKDSDETRRLSAEAAEKLLGGSSDEPVDAAAPSSKSRRETEVESATGALDDADLLIESFPERIQ